MSAIINDYARYHLVEVIAGSLIAIAFLAAGVVLWRRFMRISPRGSGGSRYERRVCLGFAVSSIFTGFIVGLISAANATNAFRPLNGFSGVVAALGSHSGPLRQSFNQWLQSGSTTPPALIAAELHHRVVFQATKAGVCAVIVVALALLCARIWRASVRWSYGGDLVTAGPSKLLRGATMASGVVTVWFAVLMLVVVVANLQSAFAPMTLTLLYGRI
jgi:hypothetical protein